MDRLIPPKTPDPAPAPPALDCWYLTGPTAAGKTRVGVELALRIGAEIVSLDSMALYREMDIGTAKPSAEDRRRAPHHLLDLVPPSEDFSLSEYIDAAHEAIAQIRSRGRQVLFVGGTPLYLKSLLRGVYQGPPADWEFRRQVEEELKSLPSDALHARLQVIDPLMAAKLHPNDTRRIIRGLEVFRLTGQRLSHLQTQFDEGRPAREAKVFVLSWPREELHQRIDARVEQMFAAGLVEEVRSLAAKYGRLSRTALQAVGYPEVLALLHSRDQWSRETGDRKQETGDVGWVKSAPADADPRGENVATSNDPASRSMPAAAWVVARGGLDPPYAACIEQVKARTRQFARRQETWFRSLSECRFVEMSEGHSPEQTAALIQNLVINDTVQP